MRLRRIMCPVEVNLVGVFGGLSTQPTHGQFLGSDANVGQLG